MGRDRLYRRYWLFPSIPGLFVEEDYSGLTEDMLLPRPSSFQNNVQCHIVNKSQAATNSAESIKMESTSSGHQVCAGAPVQMPRPIYKPNRWCFYSSQEQLDQLIVSLNSRGHRESALRENLLQEKNRIREQLNSFPVEKFHFSGKYSWFLWMYLYQLLMAATYYSFKINFKLASLL